MADEPLAPISHAGLVRRLRLRGLLSLYTANRTFCEWITHSCIRSRYQKSLLDDNEFCDLATAVYMRWNEIDHPYKVLIGRDKVKNGAGQIDYPSMIKQAAIRALEKNEKW